MSTQIKVSDIITNFFEEKGFKNVFLLSGGMMIHLLDSISKSDRIKYVCNHHEQACAIAAEGYARVSNSAGLCYATSGPGATNTITGIAGAWLDSSPVVYITGQSRTTLTVRGAGPKDLRMLGNFEVDIIEIAKPITNM
jgi:acetolactate synthase-1/2/3 large subunit